MESKLRALLADSRALAAALLAMLAGVTIVVAASIEDGHPRASITITTKNAQGEPVKVAAPKDQVDAVSSSDAGHHDAGDVESKVADRSSDRANPSAPSISGPVPLASPSQAGCLTRQIGANWSYRNGTKPSLIVLHFTVSPNVVGWGDVNSIVAFFNRPATSASSNYVIDSEGHCVLMVAESLKAWAQAGQNSATACSIEVINTGNEPTYIGRAGGAGERQLARVVHDCAQRWHIPLRRGAVSGCTVTRSGVVDHQTLGSCGGGHVDIGKFRGTAIDHTIALAKGSAKPITAGQRKRCTELNTNRRHSRDYHKRYHLKPAKPLPAKTVKRDRAILAGEKENGIVCKVGAPGKRGSITRR